MAPRRVSVQGRLRRRRGSARSAAPAPSEPVPLEGLPDRRMPYGLDGLWRPEVWRCPVTEPEIGLPVSGTAFGDGLKLFHDATAPDIRLRQEPDRGSGHGLAVDIRTFDGEFLSLVVEVPASLRAGLGPRHLIGLSVRRGGARSLDLYARLNLRCGPNTRTAVEQCACPGGADLLVEFGLDWPHLDLGQSDDLWFDLIFTAPLPPTIALLDLAVHRRLRPAF